MASNTDPIGSRFTAAQIAAHYRDALPAFRARLVVEILRGVQEDAGLYPSSVGEQARVTADEADSLVHAFEGAGRVTMVPGEHDRNLAESMNLQADHDLLLSEEERRQILRGEVPA